MAEADNTENAVTLVMAAPKRLRELGRNLFNIYKTFCFLVINEKGNGYIAMPRFSPALGSI